MDQSQAVLETAETYLREQVAPQAQKIDLEVEALREALKGLCERELMALRRPQEYGGPGLKEDDFRRFQENVARYSGTLAFLQTQHQSAGSMVNKGENEALKQEYLPKMGNGERLVGIGFSQLRRPGPPIMRATPCDDNGYRLEGTVPWITGYSIYPEFIIGAALPDGQAVFGVVPLAEQNDSDGVIELSEPMKLAAMEAAQTVSAEFKNYYLPAEKVVFIKQPGWIKNNDQINVTLQGHFALGCARAGLDIVLMAAEKKNLPFLRETHDKLLKELDECREATIQSRQSPDEETTEERLKIRAWAIDLAVRCAHAGVAASSGAANSLAHPAQRVYREALVFTVSAQTSAIMEATMERLISRS